MLKQCVGIAGYMGAGKSMGARFLSELGGTILDADAVAKNLMQNDATLQRQLAERFGTEIIQKGNINFPLLGNKAFGSRESLIALNEIVHPPLLICLRAAYEKLEGPLCILDAALIGYWHIEDWFTKRIWVTASREIRLKRLEQKAALPRELLIPRMQLQEQLVAEPSDSSWIHISNEETSEQFERALASMFRC